MFEEAHRLLRQPRGQAGGAAAHAVEMFAGLLAEIRAYGEGLIIAEQIPAKLIPDVIKNTAVKIVHRLPAADDREAVGATMNLTEDQSAYLVTLVPGEAAVFTDGMDYPLLARMPDGTSPRDRQPRPGRLPRPADHLPQPHLRTATAGPAPCTLRQVRAAQRAADQRPADHRVGRTVRAGPPDRLAHAHARPGPSPPRWPRWTSRLRDCALSHAVDAAVAARIPVISARVSGAALAVHVTAAMRAALDDGRWLCDQHEPQWLAPPYRWALVLDSLQALHRRDPGAGPHPRTAEWEAALLPRHPRRRPAPASSRRSSAGTTPTSATTSRSARSRFGTRPASRHRARRRRPRRRPGLGTAPRRRPDRVPRLPLAPGLPAARGRNLTYLAEAADSAWNASSTLSR